MILMILTLGVGQMWGTYSYNHATSVPEWTVNFDSWNGADDAATTTAVTVHNPRLYYDSSKSKWNSHSQANDIGFDAGGFYYMYQPGTARQLPTGDALSALCYVVAKAQGSYFKYNNTSTTVSSPATTINGLTTNNSQTTDVAYEFHMPRAGYIRLLIGTDSNGDPTGTANDSWKNVTLSGATTGTVAVTYHASGATYDVKTKTGATTFSTTTYTSAGKKLRSVEFAVNSGTTTMTTNPAKLSNNSGTARKMFIYAVEVYMEEASGEDPSCEATADAGADKSTTVGVGVAMAATAAGEGYTGAWSIKAESPSTATSQLGTTSSNTMTFTPNTYGTYTLVWTVTDNNDGTCSAFDEATVTVPAPTHAISYTNTKGAVNTNPDTYTEGTGIASFAKLRHVVGYDFTGWSPSSISSSATTDQTIDAQWTANAVAEGTASLTYALAFGSGSVTTSSITRVNGALYDATDVSLTHTSFADNENKTGCSGKLTTTTNKSNDNYLEVTFKIADGYTFTPTEVRVQGIAVTNDKTIEVELKDNATTPHSKSVSGTLTTVSSPVSGGYTVTLDFDASGEIALEGTVTAKIFAYGDNNKHWRIGTPFVISGTVAVPATPCAATAPGDIEKGEASGGTGKITLKVEDDGAPVSGDAWYWQSSASGEAKTDEYDAENGKEVSAAGTYYLRSYNTAGDCWSAAKSVEVTAADLLTAISPTLSYDANVIVGNTLSPTLNGNDGSGSVTYALNDVTPAGSLTINSETGVVTAVTAGGTATVTATIAANGNYAAGETTSETITVVAPATGTATISYALSGSTTTGTVAGVSTISSLSSSLTLSTLTIGDAKSGYSGAIKGCTSETELVEDDYVDVQFTVASGYVFTPSEVSVKANPLGNTSNLKAVVKIMDAQPLEVASEVLSCTKNTDNLVTFASGAFTNKEFCGTVHIRIYFYGTASSKEFWIKSPITIAGTVAVAVTKYNLTFAAGTGASGSMSTLKYAEGAEVTLPACTFTAPSGKEFDAWVVTKTVGGASVTVTNGKFTMPAEAVTATATWKDRPKHTDATLSDLTVADETVDDFDAATTSYNVELPFGTTSAPTVAATATDASYVKSVVVTQASSASGDATVVVTAEDGTTTKTYTIHFSVEATKDLILVYKTGQSSCVGSDATVAKVSAFSQYIEKTAGTEADNSSINTTATQGGKITISAKPGYAIKAMSFYGKVEDGSCGISLDGADATTLEKDPQVKTDDCYTDVFTNAEAHSFSIINTGTHGVWVRSMKLTMIQACTPKTIAWTAEPAAEYELGSSPADIAASANNGTVSYASTDGDVIAVNSSNGALTLKALGTVTLSASVPAGDGVTYCDEGAQVSKANVKTYYLVTFDAQNETTPTPIKYYSGDDAIALPEEPTYSGFDFLGWFDASTGGNAVTSAITPTASRTIYAQWEAKCAGPTITAQPVSANYFVGRTASALSCEATPGVDGKALTYTWYSCDDTERTNPVALAGAPTPSTAAIGTFYYYCAVTEADCDVVKTSNVATIAVTEKDKVCLVKADLQAGDKNASISAKTGSYKDDANIAINIAKNLKLGETGNYVKLGVTGTSFANGDEVVITLVDDSAIPAWLQVFAGTGSDLLAERKSGVTAGANTLTISNVPANQKVLYLYRTSASGTNMNPFVQSMAVYRACPAPILEGISFNGTEADADELEENTFNVELTNGTNLASMEVVRNVMWVGAHATTPYTIITNEGSWAWGANTYRVMDKDGDYADYTINLTEALPDAETPVIATDLTDHAYCAGEIPELDATANEVSDGGTLTYQWYDANGAIEGATNAKYTPESEGSYYCKVTNTLAEHRPMTTTSATAELTQKDATSISGETTFDIEQGATVKFKPTITGANATYAWYACDAEGNHEGDALGTSASYTTAALSTVGTFYYILEVVADCGNESQIFTVNVAELGKDLVAHTPGHYYGQTLKEYNGRSYEIYGFASSASDKNFLWAGAPTTSSTDQNCVLAFNKTGEVSWLTNSVNGRGNTCTSISDKAQFTETTIENGYTMNYRAAHSLVLKVKGYDQFSIYSKDNSGSSRYMEVQIDGVVVKSTATNSLKVYDFDLTDGEHVIVVRGNDESIESNNELSQFSLRLPVVAMVDETDYLFVQDAIDAASDPITITMLEDSYEDIVIANGKDVTIAGAGHTLNSITVENGGKVNASSALTLVENLYLEAQAGASGQVLGATNVTASAVYMDVTFFKGAETLDETTAGRWYMISAPFDVNLADGFYKTDGTPMVFGQTDGDNIFDLFEYDGAKRASTGVTGWKRVQGKMKAGRACLIGFNPGQPTTIRLKAASTVLSEPTSIALNEYAGDATNQNWNGVANPTLHYTDLSKDVQTYNNEDGENGRKYIAYSASSTSFVVGTAFFVQATGSIDLTAASHSEFRAPQRQANERYEACVRISRSEATEFADQMYVRASETASNEYEQGHDMITWNGTTANTALIWTENYGKRLAIEEAPLVNDKATYNLGIFVPVAGTYRIEVANPSEDATLYLTKNGRIFWNLTMGACELDLAQGQNNEYGLVLRAEAPQVTTGMDEIHSEAGVQKIIIDENVFILRGEKMYDVTGKLVK